MDGRDDRRPWRAPVLEVLAGWTARGTGTAIPNTNETGTKLDSPVEAESGPGLAAAS